MWQSEKEYKAHKRLLYYMEKNGTDKTWHLGLLSLVVPDHAIWNPSYRPPPKQKKAMQFSVDKFEDPKSFFKNA